MTVIMHNESVGLLPPVFPPGTRKIRAQWIRAGTNVPDSEAPQGTAGQGVFLEFSFSY